MIKYGRDEYVIIFPGKSKAQAIKHSENILRSIRESTCLGSEAEPARITASFGIVNYSFEVWVRKNKRYLILNRIVLISCGKPTIFFGPVISHTGKQTMNLITSSA